jgi:hypothetical protein
MADCPTVLCLVMAWVLTQKRPVWQHERELIPFSEAASRVYIETTGDYLPLFGDTAAALNSIAQAIAKVVPIYGARRVNETLKPLAARELEQGTFQRGATVFRTSMGIEYRRLYMRSADVGTAVTALKSLGLNTASYTGCPEDAPGCSRHSLASDNPGGVATSTTESRSVLVLASGKKSRRT